MIITLITVMMMIGSKVKYIYVLEAWDGWEQGGSEQWVRSWQCGEGLEDCWEEGEMIIIAMMIILIIMMMMIIMLVMMIIDMEKTTWMMIRKGLINCFS